jgi:hypothetical protein
MLFSCEEMSGGSWRIACLHMSFCIRQLFMVHAVCLSQLVTLGLRPCLRSQIARMAQRNEIDILVHTGE